MESSDEGRLGLQKLKSFGWKGKSFFEITTIIQRNALLDITTTTDKTITKMFMKPMPLHHYRAEIALTKPGGNYRTSQRIRADMETPGGTIIRSSAPADECGGNVQPVFFHVEDTETNKPCSSCYETLDLPEENNNSEYLRSLSQENSARRRVRSAGMNRPRYNQSLNNRPDNYSSSSQYLHGRNKTFEQNQYNLVRIQDTKNAANNVYASNTIQYCGPTSSEISYVPVYYKPNNGKFAVQGAVESSARLARLKFDTITDAGSKLRKAYGEQTANALSYGAAPNGYTVKDKVGYPNICTPVIKKDGTVVKC